MHTIYHRIKFIGSATNLNYAPKDQGKEIAFAGRSNVGKSSAINALTRQNTLARISKTPGCTQLLNFFAINEQLRIVDLPGYGYAKVPVVVKKKWQKMIEAYLSQRVALCGIILVMDIRHPLTSFDKNMIEWCKFAKLPLHILLTKADKLSYCARKNTLLKTKQELSKVGFNVSLQLFSALQKIDIDVAYKVMDKWFDINL